MNPLERVEALCRAVAESMGGNPEFWRKLASMIALHLPAARPHLPDSIEEFVALFMLELGEGPSDPDPGF